MADPRIVFVDVYLKAVTPLDFSVVPSDKNDPQIPTDEGQIVFNNEGYDGFEIHFELIGDTKGYFFPPNNRKHDAIWSQVGSVCPKEPVWKVFRPWRVVEPDPPNGYPFERRVLIVRNKNSHPAQGAFQYNLRVTNGKDWLDLDPGGQNNNGHVRSLSLASVTVGVLTGIVSALVTLFGVVKLGLVSPAPPGL